MTTTQIRTDIDARVIVSDIALRACIRDPLLSLDQALNTWTEEAIEATLYAEWTGAGSVHSGEPMPAVYRGTLLAHSWRSGRKDEILSGEVRDCPSCNNAAGLPCIWHDL